MADGVKLDDDARHIAWEEQLKAAGAGLDDPVRRVEFIRWFRAARRIWARWMKETYGARTDKAQWLRFHTQTAGVSLTAQQPYNNVVRTAVEALSAVLGGTNSLHTNALDETLALASAQAAEIALRTQQVLMEETRYGPRRRSARSAGFCATSGAPTRSRPASDGRGGPRRPAGPHLRTSV